MKRTARYLFYAVLAAAFLFMVTGCDWLFPPDDIETMGTWIDGYGGMRVISNEQINVYNSSTDTEAAYVFDIVEYNNEVWNGGETGEGDCGYAVLLCIDPPSWNEGQANTYTVFRWQNLGSSGSSITYEFAEGSPATWPDGYQTSGENAKQNCTFANGWFGFGYSAGTKQ